MVITVLVPTHPDFYGCRIGYDSAKQKASQLASIFQNEIESRHPAATVRARADDPFLQDISVTMVDGAVLKSLAARELLKHLRFHWREWLEAHDREVPMEAAVGPVM
jgi:hypothetical protein